MSTTPAKAQKDEFETSRKLAMALEWIELQARMKRHAKAFGRMAVEFIWDAGCIRRVKIVDEIVVEDMTDKERELVLRACAAQNSESAGDDDKPPKRTEKLFR